MSTNNGGTDNGANLNTNFQDYFTLFYKLLALFTNFFQSISKLFDPYQTPQSTLEAPLPALQSPIISPENQSQALITSTYPVLIESQ